MGCIISFIIELNMNAIYKLIRWVGHIVTFVGHIIMTNFSGLKKLSQSNRLALVTGIFLIITCISKEIIVLNEEVLVVISFFAFIYFLQSKISDMVYVELASRNEKIHGEADLNLFYHQKIINIILDLYKTASYVQNKLKNEYIFFRHVFLTNLWPCKAIDYVKNNLNVLYTEEKNIYQNIQIEHNTYNYELLKNLSKIFLDFIIAFNGCLEIRKENVLCNEIS